MLGVALRVALCCPFVLTCAGPTPGQQTNKQKNTKRSFKLWFGKWLLDKVNPTSTLPCCDWLIPGHLPPKANKKTIKQRFLKLLPCCPPGSGSSVNQSKFLCNSDPYIISIENPLTQKQHLYTHFALIHALSPTSPSPPSPSCSELQPVGLVWVCGGRPN